MMRAFTRVSIILLEEADQEVAQSLSFRLKKAEEVGAGKRRSKVLERR